MIDSFHISKIATFDEPGIHVQDLKPINFIYGTNGTGKTTLSNFLKEPSEESYKHCSIKWRHDESTETLVYNKKFREENFGEGIIPGVFTLGKATKEEKATIDRMLQELSEIRASGLQKKDTSEKMTAEKSEMENAFRDNLWANVYKTHKDEFKDAFRGHLTKELYKERFLHEFGRNKAPLESYDKLKEKAETLYGETPVALPLLLQIDSSRISEIEVDEVWSTKIVGKEDVDIAKLIQRLNISDWVSEGREYIDDSDICPFCQKTTITDEFRQQINSFFDESFKESLTKVKELASDYETLTTNLQNTLQQLESAETKNSKTKLNTDKLVSHNKTLNALFLGNQQLLESKAKEPSRSLEPKKTEELLHLIYQIIEDANVEIRKHNEMVKNYQVEKDALTASVWRYITEEYKVKTNKYIADTTGKQKGIDAVNAQRDKLRSEYADLDSKIKEANKNVTSVQASVDEINRTLQSYGFLNFQIVPSEDDNNQYQIQRDDGTHVGSTLSEGEVSLITFLYYLQRAKGGVTEETITEDRVLIIDDPVSSLDSSVLFLVSSLIKLLFDALRNGVGNVKQVILLTHNIYFHREVSYVSGTSEERKDVFFWVLRKKHKVTTIQACGMENPVHNSYELLWKELRMEGINDGITIQNIMRRIIENYFKILGKYKYEDLIEEFDNPEEREVCRSLICWINDGSHTLPDDLFMQAQDDMIDRYKNVFRQIFIKTKHGEHYNMMMGIKDVENEQV